jgi:hypothetical protein
LVEQEEGLGTVLVVNCEQQPAYQGQEEKTTLVVVLSCQLSPPLHTAFNFRQTEIYFQSSQMLA